MYDSSQIGCRMPKKVKSGSIYLMLNIDLSDTTPDRFRYKLIQFKRMRTVNSIEVIFPMFILFASIS